MQFSDERVRTRQVTPVTIALVAPSAYADGVIYTARQMELIELGLSPFAHAINGLGEACAVDCPACHWAGLRSRRQRRRDRALMRAGAPKRAVRFASGSRCAEACSDGSA